MKGASLPEPILDVGGAEARGIALADVRSGMEIVDQYDFEDKLGDILSEQARKVRLRFLFCCVCSMRALFHFVGLDLYVNELTCAIAIGQAGMARLDDAEVFARLFTSLKNSMASLEDVVVWVLVAHMLVKPHLIDAMRNIVCAEGIGPTVQKIGMVIGR